MGKLNVFNFVSLDGYFKDAKNGIGWHKHTDEDTRYAISKLKHGNTLLFGRVTYQLMEAFWPQPQAGEMEPILAPLMNKAEKIVFSKTLTAATWNNTRLIKRNMIAEVTKLKQIPDKDITILGSGNVVVQLAAAGLIDSYEILINPVALGKGTTMFEGLKKPLDLQLTSIKKFKNGNVLLTYAAVATN